MSIEAGSLDIDPTNWTPSGGTTKSFTSMGQNGLVHEAVFNGSDWLTQDRAIFKVKYPKIQTTAPNGYTQGRAEVTVRRPMVLDNGNSTFNSVWCGQSTDVETTAAEKLSMRLLAAQLLTQSAFTDYFDSLGLN